MCGIAGFLQTAPLALQQAGADLTRMAEAMAHRGPDDQGTWLEASHGVGFCHRRLSIVDLSPLGHQPMKSPSGRFVITFNGEIYNYRPLRHELAARGHVFRGTSDTEVLLAAVEEWGIAETLARCVGMFAFGIWDGAQKTLTLARDRFGEKPLYYGEFRAESSVHLLFASELKALRRHSAWRADIDRDALTLLLRHGYIPAPYSVFRQVRKVPPGCFITLRANDGRIVAEQREYWRPAPLVRDVVQTELQAHEHLENVHSALDTAIRRQMVADVPVGAFLSGGIDSSLIVAMMQRAGTQPVRTFSIGFGEQAYNEAPFARRIAEHLGTRHMEIEVAPSDALSVIPRLAEIYDEPFADSSQIPTFLVSELARRDVTVSLSGDGGDELFGGYRVYQSVDARWNQLRRVPAPVRAAFGGILSRTPLRVLDFAARSVPSLRARKGEQLADYLHERLPVLGERTFPHYYRSFVSIWTRPEDAVIGAREPSTVASDPAQWPEGANAFAHMMHIDARLYLPDDILVKVDRAAMAVSLETRVPLLDPAVAAVAASIPTSTHLRDGRGKWVLRQLLERYVPRPLFDRPKQGFAVPVAQWLRNDLKTWAGDLLDTSVLRREGFFDPAVIERRWRQHLSGNVDYSSHLWSVLMFQQWLNHWKPNAAPGPSRYEVPLTRAARA